MADIFPDISNIPSDMVDIWPDVADMSLNVTDMFLNVTDMPLNIADISPDMADIRGSECIIYVILNILCEFVKNYKQGILILKNKFEIGGI